jgi:hypothetical protein
VNPTIRILGLEDAAVLDRVAPGVFDNAVDPRWAAEFLADSRHHLAVAYLPTKNPHRRSAVRERMMPLIALRRPPCDGAVVVELRSMAAGGSGGLAPEAAGGRESGWSRR